MKFLKASIIILFILSLSSAVLTLYLSGIRENEKEKRIYLEGVNADLEERLSGLESEKAQLTEQVGRLETDNKNLKDQLKQEQEAREQALAIISQKDVDLESLRGEAEQAQVAFKDAQKRNQELERILDELEARMSQIEGQGQLPGSEVGYLEIQPAAPSQSEQKPAEAPDINFKPLTQLPEPPKKRKFFPFFGSSAEKKEDVQPLSQEAITTTEKLETAVPQPSIQLPAQASPNVHAAQPIASAPVQITDQSIAAGNVLLVNRKYNFVVINLGSRQNLNLNDTISIQEKGNEIAKARVEKVYDDYSAAYIIEEQSDHPIAEGHAVARI